MGDASLDFSMGASSFDPWTWTQYSSSDSGSMPATPCPHYVSSPLFEAYNGPSDQDRSFNYLEEPLKGHDAFAAFYAPEFPCSMNEACGDDTMSFPANTFSCLEQDPSAWDVSRLGLAAFLASTVPQYSV